MLGGEGGMGRCPVGDGRVGLVSGFLEGQRDGW